MACQRELNPKTSKSPASSDLRKSPRNLNYNNDANRSHHDSKRGNNDTRKVISRDITCRKHLNPKKKANKIASTCDDESACACSHAVACGDHHCSASSPNPKNYQTKMRKTPMKQTSTTKPPRQNSRRGACFHSARDDDDPGACCSGRDLACASQASKHSTTRASFPDSAATRVATKKPPSPILLTISQAHNHEHEDKPNIPFLLKLSNNNPRSS